MFEYDFPTGPDTSRVDVDEKGAIKFYPLLFEQRYFAVLQMLNDERWAKELKKVAEFGCGSMRFLRLLKRNQYHEHILQIDSDKSLLWNHLDQINPCITDTFFKRDRPLHYDLLAGSVSNVDESLQNVDAVIALELLEHLGPTYMKCLENNVFGIVKPKVVILTTPNVEYNAVFIELAPNGLRRIDHRFEWTRAEFKAWCLQITEKFTNYKVAIQFVGKPPAGKEEIGHASQVALFVRNDLIGLPVVPANDPPLVKPIAEYKTYCLLHSADYLRRIETRSERQILIDEINVYLNHCQRLDMYLCKEEDVYKVPMHELVGHSTRFGGTDLLVRRLLKEMPEYLVEDDHVLIARDDCSDDSSYKEELMRDDILSDSDLCGIGNDDDDIYVSQLITE